MSTGSPFQTRLVTYDTSRNCLVCECSARNASFNPHREVFDVSGDPLGMGSFRPGPMSLTILANCTNFDDASNLLRSIYTLDVEGKPTYMVNRVLEVSIGGDTVRVESKRVLRTEITGSRRTGADIRIETGQFESYATPNVDYHTKQQLFGDVPDSFEPPDGLINPYYDLVEAVERARKHGRPHK